MVVDFKLLHKKKKKTLKYLMNIRIITFVRLLSFSYVTSGRNNIFRTDTVYFNQLIFQIVFMLE